MFHISGFNIRKQEFNNCIYFRLQHILTRQTNPLTKSCYLYTIDNNNTT